MAGRSSQPHRLANMERGFEFSRLDTEWMAAVYALVVPSEQTRRQSPPLLPDEPPPATPARCRSAGGEAR